MSLKKSKLALVLVSTVFSGCVLAVTMSVTDTEITSQIKYELAKDPSFSSLQIQPSANNGIVSLKGEVNSNEEAISLIERVQETAGVKDVDTSKLVLKTTNQPILATDDIYITAKVKGLYSKEKVFGTTEWSSLGINVETNNGVVTLSGQISGKNGDITKTSFDQQVEKSVKLAKDIKGVKAVESKLVFIQE